MTDKELQRLEMLSQGPCVTPEYVREYYGLPWPLPDDVRGDFEKWAERRKRREVCSENSLSRFELERFMVQMDLISRKWAAVELGMKPESLNEVLDRLPRLAMRPHRYVIYQDFIASTFERDLVKNLQGYTIRAAEDFNTYCEELHAELNSALGLEIQPEYCASSEMLQEKPRQYARYFDSITLLPLSSKHVMWLNFRKPLYLAPDRCSKLLYVENRDRLRDYCTAQQEPDGLEEYEHFLSKVQDG